MKWLLNLYPSSWQRRYRNEVEALLEEETKTFRTVLDLMAGAIDAWLNQNWILEETKLRSEQTMITVSRYKSVEISTAEGIRCAIWNIILCLVLVFIGVTLDKTFEPNVYVKALLNSAFFISFTIACGYTFLKPYSRAARNIIIWLAIPCWYVLFLAIAVLMTLT